MKVYLSNYRNHWLSPYKICEKIVFWREVDYEEPWVRRVNKILEPVMTAWMKLLDFIHPRIEYVKVDRWDTWSMDQTLSPIILPLLKQLRDEKHGYGWVKDEDAPEELRGTAPGARDGCDEHDWDNNAEARYNYILDEMIFAFEHLVDDSWEDAYRTGVMDLQFVPVEDKPGFKQMVHGPNHTYECDYEGIKAVEKRIDNGLRLFGTYFRTLWS